MTLDIPTELFIRFSNKHPSFVYQARKYHVIFMATGYREAGGLRMLETVSRSYDSGERLVRLSWVCCTLPEYRFNIDVVKKKER